MHLKTHTKVTKYLTAEEVIKVILLKNPVSFIYESESESKFESEEFEEKQVSNWNDQDTQL